MYVDYSVMGHDKKLMSDKYYQVTPDHSYTLSLLYRSEPEVIVHLGVACYDLNKNPINPVQICRHEQTIVTVDSFVDGVFIIAEKDR